MPPTCVPTSPDLSPGRASYTFLKHLRTHGLIEKVANRYTYYLTRIARRDLVTALVIREYFVQPTLVRDALWIPCPFVQDFRSKGLMW